MKTLIPYSSLEELITNFHKEYEKVSATIIVQSKKTGKDLTFHIKVAYPRKTKVISIGIERNYMEFYYIYHIIDGKKGYVKENTGTYYKAAVWILTNLFDNNLKLITDNYDIYHIGKCIKCNRPLTDLESVDKGIGPICSAIVTIINNREDV